MCRCHVLFIDEHDQTGKRISGTPGLCDLERSRRIVESFSLRTDDILSSHTLNYTHTVGLPSRSCNAWSPFPPHSCPSRQESSRSSATFHRISDTENRLWVHRLPDTAILYIFFLEEYSTRDNTRSRVSPYRCSNLLFPFHDDRCQTLLHE